MENGKQHQYTKVRWQINKSDAETAAKMATTTTSTMTAEVNEKVHFFLLRCCKEIQRNYSLAENFNVALAHWLRHRRRCYTNSKTDNIIKVRCRTRAMHFSHFALVDCFPFSTVTNVICVRVCVCVRCRCIECTFLGGRVARRVHKLNKHCISSSWLGNGSMRMERFEMNDERQTNKKQRE